LSRYFPTLHLLVSQVPIVLLLKLYLLTKLDLQLELNLQSRLNLQLKLDLLSKLDLLLEAKLQLKFNKARIIRLITSITTSYKEFRIKVNMYV